MIVQLLPANPSDCPEIQRLAREIWHAHYTDIIGIEQIEYMLNKNYTPRALEKQMEEGQKMYVIVADGQRIGFLSVSEKSEGNYFVNKYYISRNSQRKGIGKLAFAEMLKLFPQAKEWRLQVNRQNHTAINFYFQLGFVIEKVADFDIGSGFFMNDFVMVRR